jgi:YVTN family beta-propeller protein
MLRAQLFLLVMLAVALAVLGNAPPASAEPVVIATIPVGNWPVRVGVNPLTNRIYVANDTGDSVSVIDGPTNTVVTTIPVGDWPRGVAVNMTTNRIYVANQHDNNVSVIDGATDTEIDTDGNPGNGITRIPVGSGPVGVDVNPTTNRIYVANFSWGSGSVSVIDGATNTEIDTDGNPENGTTRIPVGDRPQYVAMNSTTNRIYVANWGSSDVSVIDGATNTVVATIPVGSGPLGVDVNPSRNRVYVANYDSDNVSVIDGASNTEIDTDGNPGNGITRISVGSGPQGVAANPVTSRVYVANTESDGVSVIDGANDTVVATVPVGHWPTGVDANASTARIYATNRDDNTVSVIQDLPPVGGVAELPDVSSSSGPDYVALTGLVAAALAVIAGAWYARRRWLRA